MQNRSKRRGAHAVEFAVVAIIFMLFFFGIMEYCRLIYVRQVVDNAAREGARYAVVNNLDTTVVADTKSYVQQKMVGLDTAMKNYACQVYLADSSGKNIGNAGDAQFGQYIAVQVDLDYSPVVPSTLFMGKTIKISSKSMMYSEAN